MTTAPDVEAKAVELAQRQLDAYNARDLEAFVACYAKDVEMRVQGTDQVFARGHDAMRKSYGKLFTDNPQLHCELVRRIPMGRFVIDEESVTGFTAGGPPRRVAAIYEVADGAIKKVWFARPD